MVQGYSPSISSSLSNGEKIVTVYDYKNECNRSLTLPADEADEFIKTVSCEKKKENKKRLLLGLGATAIGAGVGAFFPNVLKFMGASGKKDGGVYGMLLGACVGCLSQFFIKDGYKKASKQLLNN